MTISFNTKEVVAHIFVYVIGLTMMGILIVKAMANCEETWIKLLFIAFFMYMSRFIGLSFIQLVNSYKNIPAVIIEGKRITINTYWTVKHIYWHQIKYMKMDEQQRSTIPRYVRFTILTKNGIEKVKVNVHLLKIDYNDLIRTLYRYRESP